MTRKHGKWSICPACEGEGKTVNPNLDANGLSDEMVEDRDFMEDYMDGAYDVPCAACDGTGKVTQERIDRLHEARSERRLAAMENGDWEAYSTAHDMRYGY